MYYRCNDSFRDMHSTHGIGGTRGMVVYACPHTNQMMCENGGICYTGTGYDNGYFINFRPFHASRRWYEGKWGFSMQTLFQDRGI